MAEVVDPDRYLPADVDESSRRIARFHDPAYSFITLKELEARSGETFDVVNIMSETGLALAPPHHRLPGTSLAIKWSLLPNTADSGHAY